VLVWAGFCNKMRFRLVGPESAVVESDVRKGGIGLVEDVRCGMVDLRSVKRHVSSTSINGI